MEVLVLWWMLGCSETDSGDLSLDDGDPVDTAVTDDTAPVDPPTNPYPVTTTPGGSEQCVILFGGSDRIRGDDDGFPVGNGARTLQTWIRTHSYQEQIALSYGRPSPGLGFLLGTVDGHPLLRLGNGLERVVIEDVDVADDEWHLLGVSWDGNLALMFVDGVNVGNGRIEGETLTGDVVAGNTPSGDLSTPWLGWLDDVKVIAGVRLPEDVAADPDAVRIDAADLLLWWDFDGVEGEGLGLTVPDLSGWERTGVAGGGEDTPMFRPCR